MSRFSPKFMNILSTKGSASSYNSAFEWFLSYWLRDWPVGVVQRAVLKGGRRVRKRSPVALIAAAYECGLAPTLEIG